jgi:membrane-associated phospholipid phosphatase
LRGTRWGLRIGLWAAVLAVFVVLLYSDVALMRLRYVLTGNEPRGLLKHLMNSFREFGQVLSVVVALIVVTTCDHRYKKIIAAALLAQGLAAAVYNPGKVLIARYRPQPAIEELATPLANDKVAALSAFTSHATWIGWRPGNFSAETQSFPSGHATGAFALAAILAWFYPRLAWMFWTLAVGCAASRYLDAVHWPSDCLAGAAVGYLAAWLALGLVMRCTGSESGRATTRGPR